MTREAGDSLQNREQFSRWKKGGRRPPSKNTRQAYDEEPSIEWREKPEPVHKAENNLAVKKKVAAGHLQKWLDKQRMTREAGDSSQDREQFSRWKKVAAGHRKKILGKHTMESQA